MIELVGVAEEHRWQLLEWRNHRDVAPYMYRTQPIGRAEHDAWFTALLTDDQRRAWVVTMDGLGVGAAFISNRDLGNRRASWAFYLADPSTRGRGVGSAVEYLVLEHAFGRLGLHKLCCEVMAFNTAVVSMHKKFGFVEEGLLREHVLREEGWVDVHVLAMLASTWQEQRQIFGERLRGRELIR